MSEILKFAIEDVTKFINDEDPDLALANVAFLSTRPNSHKINITESLLRECAPTILGKFLIGNLDYFGSDLQGHEKKPDIFGYIPKEQEVRFVEVGDAIVAYCDVIVSKVYATEVYNLFIEDNFRNVSVEMSTSAQTELPDGSLDIEYFTIHGCTILGKALNGSCPDANMSIVRFSEAEANRFYHDKFCGVRNLQKFAEERKKQMAESKTYKINKTELKDTPWGNVDKTALRNKIMAAKNRASLVRAVYALIESGWEEAPSEHLKYPLMQETGGTFYYNRHALSSALAYAKQEGEQSVITKVNRLYKKFNLDEDSREKEETKKMVEEKKMAEEEAMAEDQAEMEEEKTEMAEPEQKEDKPDSTEEKPEDTEEKMSSDANVDSAAYAEMLEQEAQRNKELAEKLEEKDNIIMQNETELETLRKFKADIEEQQRMSAVNATLASVKDRVDADTYAKFEETGKTCKFEEVDAWKNSVLAEIGASVLQFSGENNTEEHIRMEVPKNDTKKSLWDRL